MKLIKIVKLDKIISLLIISFFFNIYKIKITRKKLMKINSKKQTINKNYNQNLNNYVAIEKDQKNISNTGKQKQKFFIQQFLECKYQEQFDPTFGKIEISDIEQKSGLNNSQSVDQIRIQNLSFENLQLFSFNFQVQNQNNQKKQDKIGGKRKTKTIYFQHYLLFQNILASVKQQIFSIKKLVNQQLQKSKKIYLQTLINCKEYIFKLQRLVTQERQKQQNKLKMIQDLQFLLKQKEKNQAKLKIKLVESQEKYMQIIQARSLDNLTFTCELQNLSKQNSVNLKQKQILLQTIQALNQKIYTLEAQTKQATKNIIKSKSSQSLLSKIILDKKLDNIQITKKNQQSKKFSLNFEQNFMDYQTQWLPQNIQQAKQKCCVQKQYKNYNLKYFSAKQSKIEYQTTSRNDKNDRNIEPKKIKSIGKNKINNKNLLTQRNSPIKNLQNFHYGHKIHKMKQQIEGQLKRLKSSISTSS